VPPKDGSLADRVQRLRSRSFSDRRNILRFILYLHVTIISISAITPCRIIPEFIPNLISRIDVFRYKNDLIYLFNNTQETIFRQYESIYSFQLFSTLSLLAIYFLVCLSSRRKAYFESYADAYLVSNAGFIMMASTSSVLLFFASDFGIFQTTHSWFEDNSQQDLRFLPVPIGPLSLLITALFFEVIFLALAALAENLVSFVFGRRTPAQLPVTTRQT
jgi:hypothetical protein